MRIRRQTATRLALLSLGGLASFALAQLAFPHLGGAEVRAEEPAHPASLDDAIIAAAKRHGVPEHLVRRIIMRESKYNPKARNRSYWGLMQISYPTAKSMGFKGTPQELLNPVTNLRYAVPYLANAFVIAGKSEDAAVRLYAAGYYFTARTRGMISALRTADSVPLNGVVDEQPILAANAVVQPPESQGIFGALFSPGSQFQAQPTQVAAYSADTSQAPMGATPPMAPAAAPAAAAAPAGTFSGKSVDMVAGKTGELAPPKKWTHDGGMTSIARGEQGLEQIAAHDAGDGAAKGGRRKSHKILAFAALDVPPSSAQAYATAGQDPRFAAAASQAAIAQATSGALPTGQPVPQVDANGQPIPPADAAGQQLAASAPALEAIEVAKPAKRHVRHVARRHKPKDDATQEARASEAPVAAPEPSAQPELRQTAQ